MFPKLLKYNLMLFSTFHCKNANKISTIYALSSGFGKCGVAVIRISGPDSKEVLIRMAGFKSLPEPRKVSLRKIRNPLDQIILDHGLVMWFPGPKSFTGEDCCELQVHGSKAVVTSILTALSEINNFRPAMPGEFTKRAFYSNKLDLTEVEGLADLIEAETEAQRKQAVHQMSGALSQLYNEWKQTLTQTVAQIEAYIDFSESENIEENLIEDTKMSIKKLLCSIQKHLSDGRRGERLRNGVQTVILGAPNVGKSSLLNLLCRKEEAIVSPIAGTTRDIVSSTIDIGGYPLVIKDTAGLRQQCSDKIKRDNVDNFFQDKINCNNKEAENLERKMANEKDVTVDPIEIEGISRALNAAYSADLILLVIDPSHLSCSKSVKDSLTDYCDKLGIKDLILQCNTIISSGLKSLDNRKQNSYKRCLIILNKVDLMENKELMYDTSDVAISCKTEYGIDKFLKTLTTELEHLCGRGSIEDISCTQARHRHCLNEVITCLDTCLYTQEPDLMAHHIRLAMYSLGKLTGHVATEEILDVIFKQFCVGK